MEPARKRDEEMEPEIRPNLSVIPGGGESTPERGNLRAVGDNESSEDLAAREAKGTANEQGDVPDSERDPAAPWRNGVSAGRNMRKAKLVGNVAKKRGIWGVVIFVLGLGGITLGGGALFTTLGPISFIETVTDDLNDQLAAMEIGGDKLLTNKIPTADRKAALRGCTTLSIRCKFATISQAQVEKLSRAGIEVIPDDTFTNVFGKERTVPAGYKFKGVTYTADEWAKQIRENPDAKRAQKRANNMKYLGASDATFFGRVLKRFGVSKKPPELSGSHQDRVNALLNRAGTSSAADLKFTPVEGKDTFTLDGDSSNPPRQYSQAEVDSMNESINRIKTAKPPSMATKASIGALSVLGYADLACSVSNIIGGATIAAKVGTQMETIQYSMGIASKVQEMKAGDISVEDAQAVGDFFTQTDSREQITDLSQTISEYQTNKDGNAAVKDNPNFGKSAMDSELLKMSNSGGVAPSTDSAKQFSFGFGQSQLLSGLAGFSEIISQIVNGGPDGKACSVIQNWAVRGLGIIASVVIALVPGGQAVTATQIIVMGSLMAAMFILEQSLNAVLGGSVVESAELESDTVARGDLTWTGIAGVQSASAQPRGLMPGNAEEILAYADDRQAAKNEYIALEQDGMNQLDINNQYSFVGSLARSLVTHTSDNTTVAKGLGSIASIVRDGLLSPFSSAANAATLNPDRFKKCDDQGYAKIGLDADVQCNVRFVMPDEDLALGVDETALWMEAKGFVEPNTTTGFPAGYKPAEPAKSQGAVLDFVTGAGNGFIEQFVNQRAASIKDYNNYAKFLDYCAYRTMPYGEVFNDGTPVNGVEEGWLDGSKCRDRNEEMSHFRVYTLYKSVNEAIDVEMPSDEVAGSEVVGNLLEDSTSVDCAPGTTDAGVVDGYHDGILIPIRVCDIPGTRQIGGGDSASMQVNSRISGVYLDLVNKMKAGLGREVIRVTDSYRSNARQAEYYGASYNGAAAPGYSNHQLGVAIDFLMDSDNSLGQCVQIDGLCQLPGDPVFDWLKANAGAYKLEQLGSEYWHWHPTGL